MRIGTITTIARWAVIDHDRDGWPDLLVANDTQPNKLYRNLRNGAFEEVAVRAGVAFSEDGKARAGMGIDAADFDNSGMAGIAITNFDKEMIALYKPGRSGVYSDIALKTGVGQASRNTLGFGCLFFDANLDGHLDLLAVNGHIDETVREARGNVGYAQPPHLFLNDGRGSFRDVASAVGSGFAVSKVARGVACGDFDGDGDVDLLVTTNRGPAYLYRNDVTSGNRSVRVRLVGTKSNRDAIGAVVRLFTPDGTQSRMVKSGSSYLSQSELAVTFGIGRRERAERVVVEWPSGTVQEQAVVAAGSYEWVEGQKIRPASSAGTRR